MTLQWFAISQRIKSHPYESHATPFSPPPQTPESSLLFSAPITYQLHDVLPGCDLPFPLPSHHPSMADFHPSGLCLNSTSSKGPFLGTKCKNAPFPSPKISLTALCAPISLHTP